MNNLQDLKQKFLDFPEGPITDWKFISSIGEHWHLFEGSSFTAMNSGKFDRVESPMKKGDTLIFEIERHGGTVNGSSRAIVYTWSVDFDKFAATVMKESFRQLKPISKKYDPTGDVDSILNLIVSNKDDDRLLWNQKRDACRVLSSKIVRGNSQKTLSGRSKRFAAALSTKLLEIGWILGPQNWARKKDSTV